MPAKKHGKDLLTEMELRFVLAFEGNAIEAARSAGYANPEKECTRLMQKPRVKAAIDKKLEHAIRTSGIEVGKRLTKADILQRTIKLADVPPEKTNNTITGQVQALKLAAEMEGHIIKKTEDLTRQLEGKTDEEKEFFAEHGYWPAPKSGGSSSVQ